MPETLLAVTGRPIAQSLSPQMQRAALTEARLSGTCLRVAAQSAAEALEVCRAAGVVGLNITSPFKEEILPLVDYVSSDAASIGAVNAIRFSPEGAEAVNTDTEGVRHALSRAGAHPQGADAVVVGAGGAARAAVWALRSAGARITVINRTGERARRLGRDFGVNAAALDEPAALRVLREAAIVVNTARTVERIVPPEVFSPRQTILEADYSQISALVRDARAAGATIADGREWLIGQGIASFRMFTGKEADESAMRAALAESAAAAPNPGLRHVALVGLMGAGKSTVVLHLGSRLGLPVVELDDSITARAGRTVAAIFREQGEEAFRAHERAALEAALAGPRSVISCGGGAVLDPFNRQRLSAASYPVWLWAPPAVLAGRLAGAADCPLLEKGEDPFTILARMSGERAPLYAEIAELVVPTRGLTPGQAAERVAYETSCLGNR